MDFNPSQYGRNNTLDSRLKKQATQKEKKMAIEHMKTCSN